MNTRPIDQYTAAQLEADRAKVSALLASLSREEAAELAADLLNAVEATPVDVGVAK